MYNPEPVKQFLLSALGSPYVYGGTGQACTPIYREQRLRQYPGMGKAIRDNCPVLSGRRSGCDNCRYRGKACYDCAQLVRKAFLTLNLSFPSGASSQWKKEALWAYRGIIHPLAQSAFCVLFREDEDGDADRPMLHVGISLGTGLVIDARNHALGVMQSRFTAYPWTHMAIPRGFTVPPALYGLKKEPDLPVKPQELPSLLDLPLQERSLLIGQQGRLVQLMQTQLLRLGYRLPRFGADGKYGRETAAAVVAFQKVTGLPPSGQADRETMARLFPKPPPFVEETEDEDYA